MSASMTLVSFLLLFIATHMANAHPDYIDFDGLTVGNCVGGEYSAPETESATFNLKTATGDIVLHIDYRVDLGDDKYTIVLNTQTGGTWGPEQRVTEITSTPGILLFWQVCAQEEDFSVSINAKEVATYKYRVDTPATRLEFTQYPNAKSTLRKLAFLTSKIYQQLQEEQGDGKQTDGN